MIMMRYSQLQNRNSSMASIKRSSSFADQSRAYKGMLLERSGEGVGATPSIR